MNETKMRIRELAAWGLDRDEYRPADSLGNPEVARALVTKRAPFVLRSALVESSDFGLQEFAQQEAGVDLKAEMAGLTGFSASSIFVCSWLFSAESLSIRMRRIVRCPPRMTGLA